MSKRVKRLGRVAVFAVALWPFAGSQQAPDGDRDTWHMPGIARCSASGSTDALPIKRTYDHAFRCVVNAEEGCDELQYNM